MRQASSLRSIAPRQSGQPGWTIAGGPTPAAVAEHPAARSSAAHTFTVDATDLAAATRSLADARAGAGTVAVRITPGGLELSVEAEDHAFWQTAVLPVSATKDAVTATVGVADLADVVARAASGRSTVAFETTGSGRVRVEGVDLPADGPLPAAPPRPGRAGVLDQRIELPATLPDGVPIRLHGLAVTIPREVRTRFVQRGISLASLFQDGPDWYLSGVAQGRPMYVLVGRVAVY